MSMTPQNNLLGWRNILFCDLRWRWVTVALLLYGVLLTADLVLLDWYQHFYTAITARNANAFLRSIVTYIIIAATQALALGLISYSADMWEAELKAYFSKVWSERLSELSVAEIRAQKADQRLIDDAALAAEKIANVFPSLIFNLLKAIAFVAILWTLDVPIQLVVSESSITVSGILPTISIIFVFIQLGIVHRGRIWVSRSEKLKRGLESRARYAIFSDNGNSNLLKKATSRYISGVIKIRRIVGKAHALTTSSLNLSSMLSFVVPFLVIFQAYSLGLIDFGSLMKISATFAGFLGAVNYIFNFYREGFRGLSAVEKLRE